jgi:hypothetical protein
MFDGDGGETLELQAFIVAQNTAQANGTMYRGSRMCPQCGIIMNPTEFMYSTLGICPPCEDSRKARRVKGKMV